ncbi:MULTISPECIES: hypothetical protein [unclassified Sphingomonas]|uniref:hypothetical protein n=1 Tax=unclassified Sphingomonas TaxID=196159 RepID=UPI000B238753|nr:MULTISPECIES: hypothetical protein [unclassified Sphingomonas]
MDDLVAIGGVAVAANKASDLNKRINEECLKQFGLPENEPFKWNPPKNGWIKRNLEPDQRAALVRSVLAIAKDFDVFALVSMCGKKTSPLGGAETHEMSALLLTLERFQKQLRTDDTGLVIIDRPGGNFVSEEKYLTVCADMVASGSDYAAFNRLACPILSMPFALSRTLQIADLVVSITAAHFAGRPGAAEFFPHVLPLFSLDKDRRGGVSVKIHPDYKFRNLYHWLLKDEHFVWGHSGAPLPFSDMPYAKSAEAY